MTAGYGRRNNSAPKLLQIGPVHIKSTSLCQKDQCQTITITKDTTEWLSWKSKMKPDFSLQ